LRWWRLVPIVPLLIIALIVGLAFAAYSKIDKVDALADYPGRPAATPGRDYLIVGSDSRADLTAEQRKKLATGKAAGQRTDTIMLLHVGSDGPVLVSLPRDSYVEIPGHKRNKLNAAFSFGGPQLLVRTVEQATGIRLDDYIEVGFGGFVAITDAVGGVTLCPKRDIKDKKAGLNVKKGCQVMDGPTALGYVRARYSDPRGDLGRVERQQEFLSAVMDKATSAGTLLNPVALSKAALSGGGALTIDEDTGILDLVRFANAMRRLGGSAGKRVTVPVAGIGCRPGAGSVVLWDDDKAAQLFTARRNDHPVPAGLTKSG
jgi:LCP family protein required for cell wall assembly